MAYAAQDVRLLARAHTDMAIRTLAGIARQKTAAHPARINAAVALLDRGWGKPAQTLLGDPERPLAASVDLRELARVIAYALDRGAMPREAELLELTPQRTGERDNGAGSGS